MSNTPSNTISGLIEYRGHILAAHVPVELLTLDAMSYGISRVEDWREEARDLDYTAAERRKFAARADYLDRWLDSGCKQRISFEIDMFLASRTSISPAVVMTHNLDDYLEGMLEVSATVSPREIAMPQFAIRNNQSEPELWLTDALPLRNARLFPGPHVRIVESNVDEIISITDN
ncbi:MAG: hypothetical protein QM758_14750 [Armatimonas sp.]